MSAGYSKNIQHGLRRLEGKDHWQIGIAAETPAGQKQYYGCIII